MLKIPENVPSVGFYYHYKHDPKGTVNNYAYYVLGVGFHTEDNCRPGEEHFVIYQPLYGAPVYKASYEMATPAFDVRPLQMWMDEDVHKDNSMVRRFIRITNQSVIAQLEDIRKSMHGY